MKRSRIKKLISNKSFTFNEKSDWSNDSPKKLKHIRSHKEKSSVFAIDQLSNKYRKMKMMIYDSPFSKISKDQKKNKEAKSLKKNVKRFLKDQDTRNLYQFTGLTK